MNRENKFFQQKIILAVRQGPIKEKFRLEKLFRLDTVNATISMSNLGSYSKNFYFDKNLNHQLSYPL